MLNHLVNPTFQDEAKAREWLEAALWSNGKPICPFCGAVDHATALKSRPGLWQCNEAECRKQFTVTVGTLFERSHIPLSKWLTAVYLMCCSKKGVSAHQLHRMLGLTYKTAWFMCMRIREGMRPTSSDPLGGQNKVVEADETYIGGKEKNKHKSKRIRGAQGGAGKEAAFSLVEREGKVRSFHLPAVNAKNLKPVLHAQIDKRSYLMTDDAGVYPKLAEAFSGHGTVNHSAEEYVRHGGFMHTNTVENYFSILKRGITGTYHHVSQQHLKRYLAEFDFRYNERSGLGMGDAERAAKALVGIKGKRLTYRRTNRERQQA